MREVIISITVMAVVTYLIRAIPMLLFHGEIKNVTIRSFLDYVPCVVLATMTFPAIFHATQTPISGIIASVVAVIFAYRKKSLLTVAIVAVITVLIVEHWL